jgi:hypothetical protein
VYFGCIILIAGGRVETGAIGLGRAQGVATVPGKAVWLGKVDLPFAGISIAKSHAAGRICLHGRLAFIGALVVADVIAACGQPVTGLVQFIADHAGFMRLRERGLELQAGVSDGTTF